MAKDKKKKDKKEKKSSGTMVTILMVIISLVLIVLIQNTYIFVGIALLPTIVAYIVDRNSNKLVFKTVLAYNLSGLAPFLVGIIVEGNDVSALMSRMTDPSVWFWIYLAAGLGWAMVWAMPYVTQGVLRGIYKGQHMRLDSLQQKLLKEWGPEIKRKESEMQ